MQHPTHICYYSSVVYLPLLYSEEDYDVFGLSRKTTQYGKHIITFVSGITNSLLLFLKRCCQEITEICSQTVKVSGLCVLPH